MKSPIHVQNGKFDFNLTYFKLGLFDLGEGKVNKWNFDSSEEINKQKEFKYRNGDKN